MPSFVVTLGGLLFFRNAAYQINEGRTISPLDETFQLLGGGLDGTIGAFWSWVVGVARHRRHRRGRPARLEPAAPGASAFTMRPPLMDAVADRRLGGPGRSASSW